MLPEDVTQSVVLTLLTVIPSPADISSCHGIVNARLYYVDRGGGHGGRAVLPSTVSVK